MLSRPGLLTFIHPDEASTLLENLDTRATILNDPSPVDFSPDLADNSGVGKRVSLAGCQKCPQKINAEI